MASYPTSIVTPTDPTSGNTLASPDHAGEHQSHNAEIVALETKIGTGASTATSGKVLRATGTGTSGWGQVVLSTDVASATSADLRGVLSDETGSGNAVFGTSPTISTPTISSPTLSGTVAGTYTLGGTPAITTPPTNIGRLPGEIIAYGGFRAPTDWLICAGSAVSRSTYATLFSIISPTVGTFTITIAAPGVATLSAHGLQTGDQLYLTTTSALPTGLTANTLYYAVRVDANTFNLSTSRANAYAGTKITTSGSQSGVHTLIYCPYGLGDGSTTFNVPDLRGRVPGGSDNMGGTVASRLTLSRSQGVYGNQGSSGGEQDHVITTAELAAHQHTLASAATAGGDGSGHAWSSTSLTAATGLGSTGSDTAHNNVQPTLLTNWLIKT